MPNLGELERAVMERLWAAGGPLTARAVQDDHAPREAAGLIDDFNTMAQRLEQASRNISTWNAQIAHGCRFRGRGLSEPGY